ncbi:olfactory receptor 5L1-like [Macrotis lagotis]|uniref:olfactory receptor 5L1-like n=1 Tax=Macrotis lagotis TaxID=92651 RepID=UPI003D68EB89
MMEEEENCTAVTEFMLLGFSDHPELYIFFFLLFLMIYAITVLGNLGMIILIKISPRLHTPMYFFLSHMSFVDLCYSTIIVPKMLVNIVTENQVISFLGCIIQFYLFCTCVVTEVILLAVMAYDRFVAICNPLLYMIAMSHKLCIMLVCGSYICGTVSSLIHTCLALKISSYRSNVINHFFCDLPPLLSLSCSDVSINELLLFTVASFNEITTIVIILTSYIFILITILRIRSSEGRRKAFSTCASHLTAIVVFHGTILFIYCRPGSGNILDSDKVATVFYTVVIPMLNPLIYSLRNKDVKDALRKVIELEISTTKETRRKLRRLYDPWKRGLPFPSTAQFTEKLCISKSSLCRMPINLPVIHTLDPDSVKFYLQCIHLQMDSERPKRIWELNNLREEYDAEDHGHIEC